MQCVKYKFWPIHSPNDIPNPTYVGRSLRPKQLFTPLTHCHEQMDVQERNGQAPLFNTGQNL